MKRIILVEGVSGAGKSTLASALTAGLRAAGYSAECFLEGEASPLDLFSTAYLTPAEYHGLTATFPGCADALAESSSSVDGAFLVDYREGEARFPPQVLSFLHQREFCWKPERPVPFAEFSRVFQYLWRRFAACAGDRIFIADGSLLHHQTNDMLRNYSASDDEITAHLEGLLEAVRPLNPAVIYLSPADAADCKVQACLSRGQPPPTAETIAFWQNRQRVDLLVLDKLAVPHRIIDIPGQGRDAATEQAFSYALELAADCDSCSGGRQHAG